MFAFWTRGTANVTADSRGPALGAAGGLARRSTSSRAEFR